MLTLAISPYHLTTREPAAMAGLLLADHAVTILPTPLGATRDHTLEMSSAAVGRAVSESPRYLDMMESWSWSEALFSERLIGSVFEGEDAAADVIAASRRIEEDDALAPLRPLMRPGVFEDERVYLSAIASDVLKAGPDPAVSVPVAAGLDAFAARHGLTVVRAHASSVAQKHEARLAETGFRFVMPALLQASADRLLLARALLEEELLGMRDAILDARETGDAGPIEAAAGAYGAAFERERGDLTAPAGRGQENEVRPICGLVSVAGVTLPCGAVLRSSVEAAARMHGRGGGTPAVM
ncbi:MAG: hypothetical protein AAFU70_11295, partial [Planctomycetota bacterium]